MKIAFCNDLFLRQAHCLRVFVYEPNYSFYLCYLTLICLQAFSFGNSSCLFSINSLHNSNFKRTCSINVQTFPKANQVHLFANGYRLLESSTKIMPVRHLPDYFLGLCSDQQWYQLKGLNYFCLLPSLIFE